MVIFFRLFRIIRYKVEALSTNIWSFNKNKWFWFYLLLVVSQLLALTFSICWHNLKYGVLSQMGISYCLLYQQESFRTWTLIPVLKLKLKYIAVSSPWIIDFSRLSTVLEYLILDHWTFCFLWLLSLSYTSRFVIHLIDSTQVTL